MPFKSEAQRKLCYLLKNKGESGSWDCDEWSASTGKKKLPEHVKKQTEKDAAKATNKLPGGVGDNRKPSDFPKGVLDKGSQEEREHTSDPDIAKEIAIDHLTEDPAYYSRQREKSANSDAFRRLYDIWADKPVVKAASMTRLMAKLSSVVASPGRGSGDEEETAVNPDSSEGMQKVRPIKPVPGKMSFNAGGSRPVSPRGAARNAAAKASMSVLGFDPRGGSVKKADGPAPQQPSPSPAAAPAAPQAPASSQGAGNMLGQAWRHRGAIAPVAANAVRAGLGSNEAMTGLQNDANRFNWSALKDNAISAWNHPSTQKGIQDMYDLQAKHYKQRLGVTGQLGLALKYPGYSPDKIMAAESARIKGDMGKWMSGLGNSISKSPLGVVGNLAVNTANNHIADSEARRMTAGYGLQAAQFMRNNPFLTAGLGGLGALGLYKGISGLFGGGSGEEQRPTMQDHFEQGYATGTDPRRRRRPAA